MIVLMANPDWNTKRQPECIMGYTRGDEPEPIYQPAICRCGLYALHQLSPDEELDLVERDVEFADLEPSALGRFNSDVSIID